MEAESDFPREYTEFDVDGQFSVPLRRKCTRMHAHDRW